MIPPGFIAIWSNSIASIPPGWTFCNGANGTPDLRDKFIVGAGSTYNPDDIGGNTTHIHLLTTDGHSHLLNAGSFIKAGPNRSRDLTIETVNGDADSETNNPPYHSLPYIMRV